MGTQEPVKVFQQVRVVIWPVSEKQLLTKREGNELLSPGEGEVTSLFVTEKIIEGTRKGEPK